MIGDATQTETRFAVYHEIRDTGNEFAEFNEDLISRNDGDFGAPDLSRFRGFQKTGAPQPPVRLIFQGILGDGSETPVSLNSL